MSKKRAENVSCEDCIYIITRWCIGENKSLDCYLIKGKIKGKSLSRKKRKKVKRALMRFIRNEITNCHRFISFKKGKFPSYTKESIGKKAQDFIKDRIV